MTDNTQPEALRLANAIEYCDASVARQAINELRRLHAENETLRTGYAAALLEIESLKAQLAERAKEHADELTVAYMCGASREKELAAQQPGAAYAVLPEYGINTASHAHFRVLGFTADQMRAFADATHALRASHGQAYPTIGDLCARIKAADDAAADRDYMLDSNDCIAVLRGEWKGPLTMDKPERASHGQAPATQQVGEPECYKWEHYCRWGHGWGWGECESEYDPRLPENKQYHTEDFNDPEQVRNFRALYRHTPPSLPTAQADSVPAVEREQERIAFKDAHRHLDLDEMPDAWGRPMFKHSHVEASWLGWIARASHGQAPAQPDPAYSEACNLATALFKKHFAHLPDYASGQVVWGLFDSTEGVILQIDNMVSGLVQPPTTSPQADSVQEDAARLDWLLLRVSGAEFRRIGVHYSGNARRADVDAARKEGGAT